MAALYGLAQDRKSESDMVKWWKAHPLERPIIESILYFARIRRKAIAKHSKEKRLSVHTSRTHKQILFIGSKLGH